MNDDERTTLIDLVADLNIRQSELKALLRGDDPQNNNYHQRTNRRDIEAKLRGE